MELSFPTFRRLAGREITLPILWRRPASTAQRRMLLGLIAVSIEQNVPLIPLIENWAEDDRGYQRARLRKLAARLKAGRSLPEVIEEVPGVLHDEDLLAIRFDSQMGTRTAAVRQLLNRNEPRAAIPTRKIRGDLIYIGCVTAAALAVIPFLHLEIIPKFERMLMEFSTGQPPAMLWSLYVARLFVGFWWIFATALLVIAWCLISTKAGRFVRHSIFDRWLRSFRELYAADILRKLEITSQAGRPLAGALSTLARYHFAPQIRHKLLFVRNEVEQGADVWQSMAAVELVSAADLRLLRTSDRLGNRSWVLGQLAALKTSRTTRRLTVLAQFAVPALVLILGFIVLSQALMIFQPLVRLIEGLL